MNQKDQALKQRAEAVLGIENETDEDRIKSAYRRKVKKIHPDLNPDNPDANIVTALLNDAYKLLKGELKGKPTLLEQDKLVELVTGNLPSSSPLYNLTPYEWELYERGCFDFVAPYPSKQEEKKPKDERRLKICS